MSEKLYLGYILDKSQRDKQIFIELKCVNKKKIWLGLISIYEVEISHQDINRIIIRLQQNMISHIGSFRQEFYAHFYCGEELIVVFRDKVFHATCDPDTWRAAKQYGRSLGIVEKQLDFLTPEENRAKYFR